MDAKIVLLPGDGIGPEVVVEGQKALNVIARKFGHRFEFETCLIGGCAIDATGSALPDATTAACKSSQAILLGAVGGPKWDDPRAKTRPEAGLLKIRKELQLFANLQQPRFRPSLRTRVVPLWPAHRAEQYRLRTLTCRSRLIWQCAACCVDRTASDQARFKFKQMPELSSHGIQRSLSFGDHFRPNTVTGQQHNLRVHCSPFWSAVARHRFGFVAERLSFMFSSEKEAFH